MHDLMNDLYPVPTRRNGRLRFAWGLNHGWKWVPRVLQDPLVSWYNWIACRLGEHDLTLVEMAKAGRVPVDDAGCVDCSKQFPLSEDEATWSREELRRWHTSLKERQSLAKHIGETWSG